MERKCVICGAVFRCSPSDNKVTCSPACRSKRAALSTARVKTGTHWTDEQRERIKGDRKRMEAMANLQPIGTAAALAKPEGQRGIHNREAMLWILVDPSGRKHAAINLIDWCRQNWALFFPAESGSDSVANRIRSGFSAIASSMRAGTGRSSRPVSSYKGWRLDRLPIEIDNRCAGVETVELLNLWLNGASINAIHTELGIGHQKIIKTLISVGLMHTDEARLFRAGLTPAEIADRLGVSVRRVEWRIPYSKGAYLRENPSENALNIRKSRKNKSGE